jgi:glycine cleavage system pyridoxal-binding protein P
LYLSSQLEEINQKLKDRGILGGLGLREFSGLDCCALITVTEKHNREKIDLYARVLQEVLR